jgi:ribokinase
MSTSRFREKKNMDRPATHIVVVASFMMDLTTRLKRLPLRGETVFGDEFKSGAGGKGSNQAVCARRLGSEVTVIVKIGSDMFGEAALQNFKNEGFDTDLVFIDDEHPTGVAPIFVEETGENIIAIVPGANSYLTPRDVARGRERIKEADVLLTNFEIPLETSLYALETAKEFGCTTILNPAPAPREPVDDELFRFVDILTPNETEAKGLLGKLDRDMAPEESAGELMERGVGTVVMTLGEKGAFYLHGGGRGLVPAFKVDTIDATGAGDAFNGALAVSVAEGKGLEDSILFANRVAALSTTRFGTAPAMPFRNELDSFS